MSDHELTPEQEQLLEAVVTGDLDDGAEAVVEHVQRSEPFRLRLEALRETERLLAGAASEIRAAKGPAPGRAPAPGEEKIMATLGLDSSAEPERSSPSKGFSLGSGRFGQLAGRWTAVVAAAVLITSIVLRMPDDDPDPAPIYMGQGMTMTIREPQTFTWVLNREVQVEVEYSLSVSSAEPGHSEAPPFQFVTQETQWEPTPETTAKFPGRFRVHVLARTTDGIDLGEASLVYDPSQH